MPLFQVQTTDGVLVDTRGGLGYDEQQAAASAARRNERAARLGIEARYEIAPFTPKED